MTFQPVPGIIEVRLQYVDTEREHDDQNTFYILVGSVTTGLVDNAASAAQSWFDDYLDGLMPTTAELNRVVARDLSEEFGYEKVNTDDVAGTNAGAMASANNALLCEFYGASGGPPARGSIYWPWVAESIVDTGGAIEETFAAAADSLFSGYFTDVAGSVPGAHAIVSRYHKTVGGTPPYYRDPALSKAVGSYVVRRIVGSQRDRRNP